MKKEYNNLFLLTLLKFDASYALLQTEDKVNVHFNSNKAASLFFTTNVIKFVS